MTTVADHRIEGMPSTVDRRLVLASFALVIMLGWASRGGYAQTPTPLPAPWAAQDLGNPAPIGSSVVDNNSVAISASGTGIATDNDQFHFIYQRLADDVRIAARVDSLAPALMSSKTGLMIRGSLQPDGSQASVVLSGDGGLSFQRRKQAGGVITTTTSATQGTVPQWLGIERRGTRVVAYSSPDGETWTVIGSDSMALGTDVYVGLAVSSQDPAEGAIARTSHVLVSGLPAGQRQRTIAAATGNAWQIGGTYTIQSKNSGKATSDTHDQLHFVYQPLQGDLEVVARVASLTSLNPTAQAGVMIRESLRADSRHAFAAITAGNGYAFDWRVERGVTNEHADGGTGAAPGWVRLVRTGQTIEAYRSSDGLTWTSIGSSEITMGDQVLVGLAVASKTADIESTAVIDHFSASAPPIVGLPNLPPTVALITPVNGATFAPPATITLTAPAVDPEGRLADVTFFANDVVIGTASTLPYTFTWSSVPAGSYTLTAVAADRDGGTTTSAPVSVAVQASPNEPPAVELTAPADGATFTAPATITLTASASDPENRLARVDFYSGGTQLGSATASPYEFTWPSVAAGSYTLTAVATDADGGTTTSAAVNITVTVAQAAAQVTFTASTDHDDIVTSYLLEVFASGADVNTASPIASTDLGKPAPDANRDITVDETAFFNALPPGNYSVTVASVAPGGNARCTPVSYTR